MAEVAEALRRQMREELPEVAAIGDADLRERVVEAWAIAIARSAIAGARASEDAAGALAVVHVAAGACAFVERHEIDHDDRSARDVNRA